MKRMISIILAIILLLSSVCLADDNWICPKCGEHCVGGKFCGICGTKRPDKEEETIPQSGSASIEYCVGDIVTFGSYPQTAEGNDDTPIKWIVLDKNGDEYLFISKYALDCVQYNTERTDVTWESCSLRTWLNNSFYNKAFNVDEKQNIVFGRVKSGENLKSVTNIGNDTVDNVFLLSIEEVDKYFKNDASRVCIPTDYAIKNGAFTNNFSKAGGRVFCWWWLRSPGNSSNSAAGVDCDGSISRYGSSVNHGSASVRPCICVRFEADGFAEERSADNMEDKSNMFAASNADILSIECDDQNKAERREWDVGDIFTFGSYLQKGSGNRNTPIEWIVLDKNGDEYLLISKYSLDCKPYNGIYENTTWEKCTLRKWLNNDFYHKAFNAEERKKIIKTQVTMSKNPDYKTNPGNNTYDNVFLLSIDEIKKYFAEDASRMCVPTDHAVKYGANTNKNYAVDSQACCMWWLRTPGISSNCAAYINFGGFISYRGNDVHFSCCGVRPCIWVSLL